MKRILVLPILFLLCAITYAGKVDPVLPWFEENVQFAPYQQGTDGTLLLEVINRGENADDCIRKAKIQALYQVIFNGYEEANGIPASPALSQEADLYSKDPEFWTKYLSSTSPKEGLNYTPKAVIKSGSAVAKISKKEVQAHVIVSISINRLRENLEGKGKIKALAGFKFKPSIFIIPSDIWMKENGFMETVKVLGQDQDMYYYPKALLSSNDYMNEIIQEVESRFEGVFEIKNMKGSLDNITNEEAIPLTNGVVIQESPADIYARTVGADIWLKINCKSEMIDNGLSKQLRLSLTAYDPYTGTNAISGKTQNLKTVGDDYFNLMKSTMIGVADNFKPQLFKYFTKREEEGMKGTVTVYISDDLDVNFESIMDMNGREVKLSQVISSYLRKSANQCVADGTQTSTRLHYKAHLPVETTDWEGEIIPNSFDEYSSTLSNKLSKALDMRVTTSVQGLGKVFVTVIEKE